MTGVPFVVLHHTGHGEPHYDLMVATDDDGLLRTWRCSSWPIHAATKIEPLPDHRRAYLTHEGEVSGGRGRVRRVAAGTVSRFTETSRAVTLVVDGRIIVLPAPRNIEEAP